MKGGKAMIAPFDNKNDLTNFGTRLKRREESRKLVRMRGRLAKRDHQKNSCGSIKLNNERQKKDAVLSNTIIVNSNSSQKLQMKTDSQHGASISNVIQMTPQKLSRGLSTVNVKFRPLNFFLYF